MEKQFFLTVKVIDQLFTILTDDLELFNFLKKKFFFTKKFNNQNLIVIRKIENRWFIDYKTYKINFLSKNKEVELIDISWLIKSIIQNNLLLKKIIFIHCSAIIYKNELLVFLGKSGAGKSTIVINFPKKYWFANDILIVKKQKNSFFGYFSPFEKDILANNDRIFKISKLFFLKKDNQLKVNKLRIAVLINLFIKDNFLGSFYKEKNQIFQKEKQIYLKTILNFLKNTSFFQLSFPKKFNYKNFLQLLNEEK